MLRVSVFNKFKYARSHSRCYNVLIVNFEQVIALQVKKSQSSQSIIKIYQIFHDGGLYQLETSPLICRVNGLVSV